MQVLIRKMLVEFEDNLLTVRTKQFNKSDDKTANGELFIKVYLKDNLQDHSLLPTSKSKWCWSLKTVFKITCERIVPEHKKRSLLKLNKFKTCLWGFSPQV